MGEDISVLRVPNPYHSIEMAGDYYVNENYCDFVFRYIVGEKIKYKVRYDRNDHTSPIWTFGEGASIEESTEFEPDSVTYYTDGMKNVTFKMDPLSKCAKKLSLKNRLM